MFFTYKYGPQLDVFTFHYYILCENIVDVFLLKELMGQGGEHLFIRKKASPFLTVFTLHFARLNRAKAYCVEKLNQKLLDKSILHSLKVKHSCGINKKNAYFYPFNRFSIKI